MQMASSGVHKVLGAAAVVFFGCAQPVSRLCEEPSQSTSAIVAGQAARVYPEAAILEMPMGDKTYRCSGAVIAPSVVLTAGHCVDGHSMWKVLAPYANGQSTTAHSGETFDYMGRGDKTVSPRAHDLGLVYLDTPITLAQYPSIASRPIPLGSQIVNIGRVQDGHLSVTDLFVSNPATVSDGNSVGYPLDYASDSIIQPGDSGGPAEVPDVFPHQIVAVNSGLAPGHEILARVDLLYTWIGGRVAAHGGSSSTQVEVGRVTAGGSETSEASSEDGIPDSSSDPCAPR
jgi:hypothetical protein